MSDEKRFTLRMDADLFQEISNMALKNRRSTAKEIEYAIAIYLEDCARKEYMHSIDCKNLSSEESQEAIAKLIEISDKYFNRFK